MAPAFPLGWWSFDLGRYRPCDGTYQLYPYESLPPIDERQLRGDFAWLAGAQPSPATAAYRAALAASGQAPEPSSAKLSTLAAAVKKLGLTLPAPFVRFMGEQAMQEAVPSCTACEWDLSEAPVPCRVEPGAVTVRFLRDQQDCLFWYLHLSPDGSSRVLCSPIPFGEADLEISRDEVLANTWQCAPDFEHFVYRFWLENELWEKLESPSAELSPAQRAYVEHYEREPRA